MPLQQSRLDYIFISKHLVTNQSVSRVEIIPGILSDHSMAELELVLFHSEKGSGLWRFNNRLLQDQEFIQKAREEIRKALTGTDVYANVAKSGLLLEMLSSHIRVISIRRSKQLARKVREKEQSALENLRQAERELEQIPTAQSATVYTEAKAVVDNLEEEKGKRAILRSGAIWTEFGEKPSKYFLNLCARRDAKKHMDVVLTPEGKQIYGNRKILQHCVQHFERLYESKTIARRTGDETGVHVEDFRK